VPEVQGPAVDPTFLRAARGGAHRRGVRAEGLIPEPPPRLLGAALGVVRIQPFADRAFGWYLDQAHPSTFAAPSTGPRSGQGHLESAPEPVPAFSGASSGPSRRLGSGRAAAASAWSLARRAQR